VRPNEVIQTPIIKSADNLDTLADRVRNREKRNRTDQLAHVKKQAADTYAARLQAKRGKWGPWCEKAGLSQQQAWKYAAFGEITLKEWFRSLSEDEQWAEWQKTSGNAPAREDEQEPEEESAKPQPVPKTPPTHPRQPPVTEEEDAEDEDDAEEPEAEAEAEAEAEDAEDAEEPEEASEPDSTNRRPGGGPVKTTSRKRPGLPRIKTSPIFAERESALRQLVKKIRSIGQMTEKRFNDLVSKTIPVKHFKAMVEMLPYLRLVEDNGKVELIADEDARDLCTLVRARLEKAYKVMRSGSRFKFDYDLLELTISELYDLVSNCAGGHARAKRGS
jgi:hypothetical protein